jgi:hypothetical protein
MPWGTTPTDLASVSPLGTIAAIAMFEYARVISDGRRKSSSRPRHCARFAFPCSPPEPVPGAVRSASARRGGRRSQRLGATPRRHRAPRARRPLTFTQRRRRPNRLPSAHARCSPNCVGSMSRSRSNRATAARTFIVIGRRQLVGGGDDVDHVTAQTIELADHQDVAAFEAIKKTPPAGLPGGSRSEALRSPAAS